MKRRKFLAGASGVGLGGSTLIGSGAFSALESHRQVTVEVAEDSDAYLGLEPCSTPNGENFVGDDGLGHVTIDIGDFDDGGYERLTGEGINSDSLTAFDNVLRICNQGKEDACIWIDADVAEELLDEHDTSLPTIDFYVLDSDDEPRTILGEENAVKLPVGECFCVGVRVVSKNLSAGDQVVEDEEIRIVADVEGTDDCPEVNGNDIPPTGDEPAGESISWIAFCGSDVTDDDITLVEVETNDEGDPVRVEWNSSENIDTSVVFGGSELYNRDGGTSGTVVRDGEEVTWQGGQNGTEQRPNSPCPDGECGPKYDWQSASGMFELEGHQNECNDD